MTTFRSQILCASGEPRAKANQGFAKWLVAFWIPVPPGPKRKRRDLALRPSLVRDAQPFELRALADGALVEIGATFLFELGMPLKERRERIDEEYRKKCAELLGFMPDSPSTLVVSTDGRSHAPGVMPDS